MRGDEAGQAREDERLHAEPVVTADGLGRRGGIGDFLERRAKQRVEIRIELGLLGLAGLDVELLEKRARVLDEADVELLRPGLVVFDIAAHRRRVPTGS
jgi:hypothetical protein